MYNFLLSNELSQLTFLADAFRLVLSTLAFCHSTAASSQSIEKLSLPFLGSSGELIHVVSPSFSSLVKAIRLYNHQWSMQHGHVNGQES
jgi:hypothetical protein